MRSDKIKNFFRAVWEYIKKARVELVVFAALLIVDLVTKAIVDATMSVGQTIEVIPKFLNISYTRNPAAAFGSAFGLEKVLSPLGVQIVLLIVTFIAIVFFSVYLYRIRDKHIVGRLGLALLISGAIGNFIDRAIFQYVRDFVEIVYFGLDIPWLGSSFAIFNIADVGVTVGVVLFLVYIIFLSGLGKDDPKKEEENATKSEVVILDEGEASAETEKDEIAASEEIGGSEGIPKAGEESQ